MSDQDQTFFDPRIADWLEGDPNEAPDQALQIVLAAFPSIKQRRAMRVPRRFFAMTTAPKLAIGAAAVIAVVLGGSFILGPGSPGPGGGPGPSPSPSPSISPSPSPSTSAATDTSTWTPFTSDRHGFSAAVPPAFSSTAATEAWTIPEEPRTGFDTFYGGPGNNTWIAASMARPAGTTEQAWFDAYRQGQGVDVSDPCWPPLEGWSPVTIDGRSAALGLGCGTLDVLLFVEDRVYDFGAYGPPSGVFGVPDEFRAMFDAWLTTITLDPGSAVEPPPVGPSPSPS
jgi:hypothetical protein